MPEYVTRDEYKATMDLLKGAVDDLKGDLKDFKENDFKEVKDTVRKLHKVLVESNGGRSIIDRLNDNERDVMKLSDKVSSIIEDRNKKYKNFYDRFWVYFIRFIVTLMALILMAIFVDDNTLIMRLLTDLLKII